MRVKIRFSLEAEGKIKKSGRKVIDGLFIESHIDRTPLTGEIILSARAFRAAEVAGVGRFNGDSCRVSPVDRFADDPGEDIAGYDLTQVEQPSGVQMRDNYQV